jgi:hypothetical protein
MESLLPPKEEHILMHFTLNKERSSEKRDADTTTDRFADGEGRYKQKALN